MDLSNLADSTTTTTMYEATHIWHLELQGVHLPPSHQELSHLVVQVVGFLHLAPPLVQELKFGAPAVLDATNGLAFPLQGTPQ